MASKTSESQRNALVLRAEEIGLDATLAHECRSEEQQDAMLQLQNRIDLNKAAHEMKLDKASDKPGREFDAAQKKFNEVLEYIGETLSTEEEFKFFHKMKEFKLRKKTPQAKWHRDSFKKEASLKMKSPIFTESRKNILLAELMRFFDTHQPSDEIVAKINRIHNNPHID